MDDDRRGHVLALDDQLRHDHRRRRHLRPARGLVQLGESAAALAERTGIPIDNTRPSIVSSNPADGSVVSSASSIALTASEPIASVANAKLDGSTVTPTVSGTAITVNAGSFASGPHVLEGLLVDGAGKRAHFRVAFTIPTSGSDAPYVEKNTSPTAATTVTAVGGTASVTMPSGAYTPQAAGTDGNDWLVLRVDPILPPTSPGDGLSAAGPAVDVTAAWAVAGTNVTSFDKPLEIVLTNTSGGNVVPATFENSAWRVLAKLAIAGTLPSDWRDGYYVGGDGIHVLTRHLTKFALLIDNDAPSTPTNLAGTIAERLADPDLDSRQGAERRRDDDDPVRQRRRVRPLRRHRHQREHGTVHGRRHADVRARRRRRRRQRQPEDRLGARRAGRLRQDPRRGDCAPERPRPRRRHRHHRALDPACGHGRRAGATSIVAAGSAVNLTSSGGGPARAPGTGTGAGTGTGTGRVQEPARPGLGLRQRIG